MCSYKHKCVLLGVCPGFWLYLQVEKLQAVQFVEQVMGESGQLAAVHVQALQLLQSPECSTFPGAAEGGYHPDPAPPEPSGC